MEGRGQGSLALGAPGTTEERAEAGQVDPEAQRAASYGDQCLEGPEVLLEDKPSFIHLTCMLGART